MDTYRTIDKDVSGIIFKDKSSKFLGYAFAVSSQDQIKKQLELVKKEHFSARHWCYAWQLGKQDKQYRANDDGEPNGTAGLPIYGQIQSFDLTNILVVVVRYFGGIKLGVGGLINAYKTTAQMVLEQVEVVEKTIDCIFEIRFEYPLINKIMRVLKEKNISVIDQKMELDCRVYIQVRLGQKEIINQIFQQMYAVQIKEVV